jgi:4'-phosphopantetheinyl transferase
VDRPLPWPADPGDRSAGDWLPPGADAPASLWLIDRRALPPSVRDGLRPLLSQEEHRRLERFRRPDDRDRFLLGRGVLRALLSQLLELPPAALRFEPGPQGKPALAKPTVHFNVAHSADLVLLGFHAWRPVGVDVERHRERLNWQAIARRYFEPPVCAALEQLEPARRTVAFHRHWCRLEAVLKAHGTGLAGLRPPGAIEPGADVSDVRLPAGYSAAVALSAPAPPAVASVRARPPSP